MLVFSCRNVHAHLQDGEEEGKEEFAIVFAAMGVNMETAHYFKQVSYPLEQQSCALDHCIFPHHVQ